MKKTIIALYGRANEGKSQTLKKVCQLIMANFPNAKSTPAVINYDGDILVTIDVCSIKIGIESQGDPNSRMINEDTLGKLANEKCDIIICATRTHGETVRKVDELATSVDYYTLWLSSFWSPETATEPLNSEVLNKMAAENIIEIIKSLIIGQL